MIDTHVHLRDWSQKQKETIKHGLYIAWKSGLDAVFEMPNTSPALTSTKTIVERLEMADKAVEEHKQKNPGFDIYHGLYAGITISPKQILEVIDLYKGLFPHVVGLKMFAGESTGDMGIINEIDQLAVYMNIARFNYDGVLFVHCEKEACMKKELWDPSSPYTHTLARPPEAEVESVRDQIRFAEEAGFKGTLHIAHISVPEALEAIEQARKSVRYKITCGLTPHHAMLYAEMMKKDNGLLLKMNPPLRPREMQEYMLQALIKGRINWIESDHAPHTLEDKLDKEKPKPHASGVPVLPYWPYFIGFLRKHMSWEQIHRITHGNIIKEFGLQIPDSRRIEKIVEKGFEDLSGEYEFDAFKDVKAA